MWLIHHRITRRGETSPPSIRDAELHFKIPCSTIQGWKRAYAKVRGLRFGDSIRFE
ncbi:hypothetical protein BGZ61DRAFT_459222 [Ilyonectria robusta]|uniref:uncharacterized protein n=1 Tax=Ilyonectria robusta TaxID=1079257 RepID=UPI001E8EBC0A|nr:uncharacterized protein BGZ61DRAFT_459222 [Ilyonectria robusta]KAH8672381.1 hypothetical protein BGZ61DRAFT_459222 [Ilyonectria robusta]